MIYADMCHYLSDFLVGKKPIIPADDFGYWAKQASAILDARTFGRLQADPSLVTEAVRDCTCALAQFLYREDRARHSGEAAGVAGAMTHYSNDGQSASYDVSASVYTPEGREKEISRIVSLYLAHSGLLYAGGVVMPF